MAGWKPWVTIKVPWLFYFLKVGGIKKGDSRHCHFKESEDRIEWCLLGEADVRRRGGIEETLW